MKQKQNHNKPWTYADEQELLNRLGDTTIPRIATSLGRSIESVIRKLERLGYYDKAVETGAFRTYELADVIGVDPTTILRWIKEESLPAHRYYSEGKHDKRKRYHYVFPHEFWKWAKKNNSLINFHKLQRDVLLPEPEWLNEAIQNEKKAARTQAYWTADEDKQIFDMFYNKGMTQESIGRYIGRSRRAVQKRLSVLREQNKSCKKTS